MWRRPRRSPFQIPSYSITDSLPVDHFFRGHKRTDFHYEPLDEQPREFRLLGVQPGADFEDIHCILTHFSCIDELYPSYTALSYCWEDSEDIRIIVVNGFNVSVTKNLESALRELRRCGRDWIWVHDLCVNQGDQDEKDSHILRAQDIYGNADETIAWLGTDVYNSAEPAFTLVLYLADQNTEDFIQEMTDALSDVSNKHNFRGKALRQMTELPYWRRTWTIQEIAFSRAVEIWWGACAINFKLLRKSIYRLQACKMKPSFAKGYQNIMNLLKIMNLVSRTSTVSQLDLHTALRYSCSSKATESIDKIFALLNLCYDGSELIPNPKYHQSVGGVLQQIMMKQLRAANGKAAPSFMDMICIDNPKVPKTEDLPSWMIDWRSLWHSQEGSIRSSRSKRGLESNYHACGNSLASISFSDDNAILIVSGYVFDTIHSLSDRAAEARNELNMCLEVWNVPLDNISTESPGLENAYGTEARLYEAIWRSLVQDRTADGTVTAPSSVASHFSKLWSRSGQSMITERASFVKANISIVGDFMIHGRTLRDWSWKESVLVMGNSDEEDEVATDEESDLKDFDDFIRALKFPLMRRRVMTTSKGYVGLGHCQAAKGDTICLLKGCSMPMIIREFKDDWKVIGEAYVHGVMDGEFWNCQKVTSQTSDMIDFHFR